MGKSYSVVIHPEDNYELSLSVPRSALIFKHFSIRELFVTANVCRQLREHIFAPGFSHCLFCHNSKVVQGAKAGLLKEVRSKRFKGQFRKSMEYNCKFNLWLSIPEISYGVINLNSPHQSVLVTAALFRRFRLNLLLLLL